MKTVMMLAVALILCLTGCTEQYSVSVWGDEELGVRIGNYIDEEKTTEIGVSGLWLDSEEAPARIGVYAIRYLPEIIQIPNPIVWEGLPKTLSGKPYFGPAIERDLNLDETNFSLIAGVTIENFLFIQEQFVEGLPDKTVIGIKWDF